MTELKNEFSWSKTRDEVFKACPRQYWFAYYGYWNGWLDNAPGRTRQIYVLKVYNIRHTSPSLFSNPRNVPNEMCGNKIP